MNPMRIAAGRAGMTFVELLVALVIAAAVVGGAMTLFRSEADAVAAGSGRMNVTQNYRFALSTLSRDLRTAGIGATPTQPQLVYAGADVVAFNANYASRDANDYYAVYYDPNADANAVQALRREDRFTLPRTTFAYPDTSFTDQGMNGAAETIIFYFSPDSSTSRTDDFVLWRQVNRTPAEVVSRNLLRTPGKSFFEYLRQVDPDDAPALIEPVPSNQLPLAHTARYHGADADTGAVAAIDRIRGVRVNVTATNGRTGTREQKQSGTRAVRLSNAGVAMLQTCGELPVFGSGLGAVALVNADGSRSVRLTWSPASDERN
ncbi:MAG TPA: hypothetical protein VFQ39_00145, partial [Longimicrobium sp.]|nr:hypothetical protein [Longimicrobium sp.]